MILIESNYWDVIQSYTLEDWRPLVKLIPEMERTRKFGWWVTEKGDPDHLPVAPYIQHGELVDTFLKVVYALPIIIDFNWMEWREGIRMVSDTRFDYDTVDIPTKCKLLTALIRNERYCEGYLLGSFQSGVVLRIVKSIKRQLEEKEKKEPV